MDLTEKRLANFKKLLAEYDTHGYFAEAIGSSRSYISHVLSGKRKIGYSFSRRIEIALGLEENWMDKKH